MFEQYERSLLPQEKRLLAQKISLRRKQRNASLRRSFFVSFGGASALAALVLLASDASHYVAGLFFLGLGLTMWLWVGFSSKSEFSKSVAELEDALSRNTASVTHIASQEMIEFEEIEDEGACYAFQILENKIIFVCGQDFYSSSKFPNTDFEIIEVFNSREKLVEGFIEKKGVLLAPFRKISAGIKKTLVQPEHLAVIEGQLDKVETILKSAS
jgi:hypothetical protein